MTKKTDILQKILASTYALMIKTHNYHWNVEGKEFFSLHELFEKEYNDLFEAVDNLAERIRFFEEKANAGLGIYQKTSIIKDGDGNFSEEKMLEDLLLCNKDMVGLLKEGINAASNDNDFATEALLTNRAEIHEKNEWMLRSLLAH